MKTSIRALVIAFASTALLASASLAEPAYDAVSFGNGVSFATDFNYEKAWISVSGPDGFSAHQELNGLDDLNFVFGDVAADGLYNWQLLTVGPIDEDLRAKLDAAAPARAEGLTKNLPGVPSATFSGTFTVRGGAVELPTRNEGPGDFDIPLKVTIITDDQVVRNSLCVGGDCANSESWGSDTIRLKENNLRIHFDDTSSSASFPNNDWRLAANATGNGGLNFFGIQDASANNYPFRIEAGAGGNALYIDDSANIGVGTNSPNVEVHVVDGDSPTLRLEQDGSAGFGSQRWDLAGNETNFFIRDATNGSPLPFRILPGSGNDDGVVIAADGDVGLSTASPQARLHVQGGDLLVRGGGSNFTSSNDAVVALFQNNAAETDGSIISILAGNGSANAQMWFGDADDDNAGRIIYRNGSDAMSFWTGATERFFIESDGDICIGCNNAQGDAIRHSNGAVLTSGGTWTNASSRALKQDVSELSASDAIAALEGLAPVTFRYKSELDETYVGFIAEDVPALVAMKDRKSLTSMDVVAVLTKVVQELREDNQQQEAELRAMRERLQALESVD